MQATSKVPLRLLAALAVLFLMAGCGSDDDSADDATVTTTAPSDPGTEMDDDDGASSSEHDAFCDVGPRISDPMPASYLGSPEHVDDLREMAALAPDDIADDIALVVEHFEQGVEQPEPGADAMDSVPDDVAVAIQRVLLYTDQNCT